MKKSTAFLLLMLSAACVVSASENLIVNPGFEEGTPQTGEKPLPGWKARAVGGVWKYHHITDFEPHSGKRCALIQVPESAPAGTECYFAFLKKIRLTSGKTYRLTFWARPLEGHAVMRMVTHTASGGYNGHREVRVKSDPNVKTWKRYKLEWLVPARANGYVDYSFMVLKTGHGTLYLDDFALEEITPENYKVDFYPTSVNHHQTLPVIKGDLAHMSFYPYTAEKAAGHTLELDLPQGMTLMAAQPVYLGYNNEINFTSTPQGSRTICQIPMPSKTIFPMPQYARARQRGTALIFRIGENIQPDKLNWKLVKEGKTAISGSIKIVPENRVNGKLPEKFKVYDWYSPFLSFTENREIADKYIQHQQQSGIIGGSLDRGHGADMFNKRDFANFNCTWLGNSLNDCLTGMIEDDYLRNGVARRLAELKDFKFAYLNWNREPFMPEYYHWCERCKAAFEKHSGKNAANMKTGNEVEKAYPQEFLKFRSSQHHAITKLYADMCKKANVTPVLCSYARSGSVSGDLRLEKMAGDQKTYYREFAMITPMIYQTPDKLWDPIKINQAYYPGIIPVYTSDENSNGNTPGYSIITPESVYLETMISAMLNCRGICLFVGYHTFNGQQINALRKALDEIAAMEEFFFSGDQAPADTVKVLSSSLTIRSRVYRKGTRLVLGVVNPDTEKEGFIEFQVNVPGKLFSLKDLKRNKYYNKNNRYALNSSDKCVIKLTPGEIAYLELAEPVRGKIRMPGIVMPEKPQGSKAKVLLTNKSWKCVQKDGVLDISAAGIAYQVYATDGGVLGGKNILAGGNGNGGFFRDLLLVPKAANWCPDSRSEYTVKSVKTLGNDLKIVLSRKYRLAAVAGLEIEKTYTFATNGSVRADIRLINNSSKPLKLAYWSHNRTALPEGKAFFTYGKNKVLDAARTNAQDFRTPAEKPYVINEKTAGSIECLTGTVDQYYFWLGSHGASMEFFGQPYTVEPGKEGKAAFIFTPAKVLPLKKKVKL